LGLMWWRSWIMVSSLIVAEKVVVGMAPTVPPSQLVELK
jgi:hypothetical protein